MAKSTARAERANLKRLERERARVAKLIERLEKITGGGCAPKPTLRAQTRQAIAAAIEELLAARGSELDGDYLAAQSARYLEKPKPARAESLLDVTRRMELESARKIAGEIESAINQAETRIATAEKAAA